MADIITKDSEEFKELTGWIKRTGKKLEAAAARIRPTIADEHYLSGDEVCRMLHVSKRTLQTLRDEKAIPYTSITSVGGKLLYPESGLYEVLKKNYKDFRRYLKISNLPEYEKHPSTFAEGCFFILILIGQAIHGTNLVAHPIRIFPNLRIDQFSIDLCGKNRFVS